LKILTKNNGFDLQKMPKLGNESKLLKQQQKDGTQPPINKEYLPQFGL
jgi:hypothetical protein